MVVDQSFKNFKPSADIDTILNQLGLDGIPIVSSRFSMAESSSVPIYPLGRPQEDGTDFLPTFTVELVQSYGRGHVRNVPELELFDGHPAFGKIAVKGGGVEGWVNRNRTWFDKEHGKRGVKTGISTDADLLFDLNGEYLSNKIGLRSPKTLFVAQIEDGYQIGRLWECPYRIWEISSGPWRTGSLVSECFFIVNWGVELIYALKFKHKVQSQVKSRLTSCGSGFETVEMAVSCLENKLLNNVALAALMPVQLLPFAFHLANISYLGETSGFDRIVGPGSSMTARRLGILCALFDTWAAVSWVRATSGLGHVNFDKYFASFQSVLSSHNGKSPIEPFFLWSRDLDKLFHGEQSCRYSGRLFNMPFSVRQNGDIRRFTRAAETFFNGLTAIYNDEIADLEELKIWLEKVSFDKIEEQRILQWFCGDIQGSRKTSFNMKIDQHRNLLKIFLRADFSSQF